MLEQKNRSEMSAKKEKYDKAIAELLLHPEAKIGLVFLALVLFISPWLVANNQEFDPTLCSLREELIRSTRNVVISCKDELGENIDFTLTFLIFHFDATTLSQEQIDNPPFFTSEYASDINNPNFNCHSLTLQLIEIATGVDFGADQRAWLEGGFDDFIEYFSQEVTRIDAIPENLTEDVINTSNVQPHDVVFFFDNQGELVHSATVVGNATSIDGIEFIQILNKLGIGGQLYSSIDDMVKLYELGGQYVETTQSGGGYIIVYRPDIERIRTSFSHN